MIYISKAMDLFDMSALADEDSMAEATGERASSSISSNSNSNSSAVDYSTFTANSPMSTSASVRNRSADTRAHAARSILRTRTVLAEEENRLRAGLARIQCPLLVIGVQSDILFPVCVFFFSLLCMCWCVCVL
jgi:homoserine acetyltransferase